MSKKNFDINEIVRLNNMRTQGDWEIKKYNFKNNSKYTTCIIPKNGAKDNPLTEDCPYYEDYLQSVSICDNERYYPKCVSEEDMEFIAKAPCMAEMLIEIKNKTGIDDFRLIIDRLNNEDNKDERSKAVSEGMKMHWKRRKAQKEMKEMSDNRNIVELNGICYEPKYNKYEIDEMSTWVIYAGYGCPVDGNEIVEIEVRDTNKTKIIDYAYNIHWVDYQNKEFIPDDDDVISYRVVTDLYEKSSEREFRECLSAMSDVNDPVNPKHYTRGSMELIEAFEGVLGNREFVGAMKFNITKYVMRFDKKNGIEDLEKAKWYLERLITYMEEDNG